MFKSEELISINTLIDCWKSDSGFLNLDFLILLTNKIMSNANIAELRKNSPYYILSGHSKIDKTKVLKTNCSLMKVKSIAECSLRAFCNTFDLH